MSSSVYVRSVMPRPPYIRLLASRCCGHEVLRSAEQRISPFRHPNVTREGVVMLGRVAHDVQLYI